MSLENRKNCYFLDLDPVSWELSEGGHPGLSHVLCLNCCSDKGIHQGLEDKYQIGHNLGVLSEVFTIRWCNRSQKCLYQIWCIWHHRVTHIHIICTLQNTNAIHYKVMINICKTSQDSLFITLCKKKKKKEKKSTSFICNF